MSPISSMNGGRSIDAERVSTLIADLEQGLVAMLQEQALLQAKRAEIDRALDAKRSEIDRQRGAIMGARMLLMPDAEKTGADGQGVKNVS